MQNQKLALCFGLFMLSVVEASHAQLTFQKTFGGTGIDAGRAVLQTNEGGYVILGNTTSFGHGGADIYLIKTDSNGSTQWSKTYGGTGDEDGYSIQQTNDGGFIIGGHTNSFGAGVFDAYLIKTSSDGSLQWSKTFGGTDNDEAWSVQQTNDGGFAVVGLTYSYGSGYEDIYLIKTDSNGNLQWTKTYGGTGDDDGYAIRQTNDGGFIITGTTNSFGGNDALLMKTDSNGNLQWSKTIDSSAVGSIQQTNEGGFIMCGGTSPGAGNGDMYLAKTASDGTIQWSKAFGGTGWDHAAGATNITIKTSDGGYVLGGLTNSFGAGSDDLYVVKTDSVGNLLWSKTYGGTGSDEGSFIQQTNDGGYVVLGFTTSFGIGSYNLYLVKINAEGSSGCNESIPNTIVTTPTTIVTSVTPQVSSGGIETTPPTVVGTGCISTTLCTTAGVNNLAAVTDQISIYPNPFSSTATVNINGQLNLPAVGRNDNGEFSMYDVYGREMKKLSIVNYPFSINRGNLPSGIYFYRISQKGENKMFSGKLVVE